MNLAAGAVNVFVDATCPTGTKVVGGGFNVGWGVDVVGSYPVGYSKWQIRAYNPKSSARIVRAHAICADVTP